MEPDNARSLPNEIHGRTIPNGMPCSAGVSARPSLTNRIHQPPSGQLAASRTAGL